MYPDVPLLPHHYILLGAQDGNFKCTEDTKAALNTLKEIMSIPSVLFLPNMKRLFHVFTDAFKGAVDMILTQQDDNGKLKAFQFASRGLTRVERSYRTFEKKAVVTIFALKKFRNDLLLALFMVYSDREALLAAVEKADIHGGPTRCFNFLAEDEF